MSIKIDDIIKKILLKKLTWKAILRQHRCHYSTASPAPIITKCKSIKKKRILNQSNCKIEPFNRLTLSASSAPWRSPLERFRAGLIAIFSYSAHSRLSEKINQVINGFDDGKKVTHVCEQHFDGHNSRLSHS